MLTLRAFTKARSVLEAILISGQYRISMRKRPLSELLM